MRHLIPCYVLATSEVFPLSSSSDKTYREDLETFLRDMESFEKHEKEEVDALRAAIRRAYHGLPEEGDFHLALDPSDLKPGAIFGHFGLIYRMESLVLRPGKRASGLVPALVVREDAGLTQTVFKSQEKTQEKSR